MSRIYKYPLTHGFTTLELPEGASIISVREQHGKPYIWAVVDPDKPSAPRFFQMIATGQEFDDAIERYYKDTVLLAAGDLVYHVFELEEAPDDPQ